MATSEEAMSQSASSRVSLRPVWICSDKGGGVGLELIATPHLLATSLKGSSEPGP